MSVSQARAIVSARQPRRARPTALPPAWRDDDDVIFCRSHRQLHEIRWFDRVPLWIWIVAATDVVWIIAGIAGEIAGVM